MLATMLGVRSGMKRNQELCIQIMKISRAAESSMSRLSYRDFEGITIDVGAFKSYTVVA